MKKLIFSICIILIVTSCRRHHRLELTVTSLTYQQNNIQKQFDTLYNYQQTKPGIYNGLIEQALAVCKNKEEPKDSITQDVISSMYLNKNTGRYDCVTTTTFKFPKGTISATGVFNLTPGDTIAPNHNFPIIGGSDAYRDIYGTYTRKYYDGVYHVELRYRKLN